MTTSALPLPLKAPLPLTREQIGLGAIGALGLIAIAGAVQAMVPDRDVERDKVSVAQPAAATATDATTAVQLRDVSADEAKALNAAIPLSLPLGAARPFTLDKASVESKAQALECLTSAIYYEAGQESDAGQKAVAQVILNRVRHPAFPASVCGVVYQGSTRQSGCQFTFTCDGSLARAPMPDAWDRARRNALAMLQGEVLPSVGLATHYHADYVMPYWAPTLTKTQVIGAHLFYRWKGQWGTPAAFAQGYTGREANAASLRRAALAVPHTLPKALVTAKSEAVATLGEIKGVDAKLTRSGRVQAHFAEARAATDKVKPVPYVERVQASDNLKFALDGAPASEAAFGAPKPAAPGSN